MGLDQCKNDMWHKNLRKNIYFVEIESPLVYHCMSTLQWAIITCVKGVTRKGGEKGVWGGGCVHVECTKVKTPIR